MFYFIVQRFKFRNIHGKCSLVGRSLRFDATAGRELKVAPRLADYVKMAATPDAWLVLPGGDIM